MAAHRLFRDYEIIQSLLLWIGCLQERLCWNIVMLSTVIIKLGDLCINSVNSVPGLLIVSMMILTESVYDAIA